MNQVQLKWKPQDVVGVYYKMDDQKNASKSVHDLVKGIYCKLE